MISRYCAVKIVSIYIVGLCLCLVGAGCVSQAGFPVPTTTTLTPPPAPTANSVVAATPVSALTEAPPGQISSLEPLSPTRLMLWTVESVSPQADGEAGEIFGNGLKAFEVSYPDAPITVVLKSESGKGSVLDYLRVASPVAPSILPDIVVLTTVDLAPAARAGLVVPLDGLVSASLLDDMVPSALAAGTVDGRLVGIPFEMDVEHLIYNSNKVASTPIVWTDIISANTIYVFPAKGRNGLVNDAFLIQYLALGGRLQDDEGRPILDERPLQMVLAYYREGLEKGVIPAEVLTIGTSDDIWPEYVSARVGIAHVNSRRFLKDRSVLRSTQFAAIPTRDGTLLTISRGRVLAIATQDPGRQAVASRLVDWLMAADNNAAWSKATATLPTRYAAFKLVGDNDPYWSFLLRQLEVAVPPPAFAEYDQIGRILQQAIVEVLTGETTPQDAASTAVDAITP